MGDLKTAECHCLRYTVTKEWIQYVGNVIHMEKLLFICLIDARLRRNLSLNILTLHPILSKVPHI
jgi:hypothetical protein